MIVPVGVSSSKKENVTSFTSVSYPSALAAASCLRQFAAPAEIPGGVFWTSVPPESTSSFVFGPQVGALKSLLHLSLVLWVTEVTKMPWGICMKEPGTDCSLVNRLGVEPSVAALATRLFSCFSIGRLPSVADQFSLMIHRGTSSPSQAAWGLLWMI